MGSRRTCLLAVAVAGLGAACAARPAASAEACYERSVALPADLATAIAAGAMRHALPFADPLPQAGGSPASVLGDGQFEIVFEQGPGHDWVPCASHRLTVMSPASDLLQEVSVHSEALTGPRRLRAFGARAVARLHLRIAPGGGGSRVVGTLPALHADELRSALDRAFALAVDPTVPVLGASESNLAALVCHRLLVAAKKALAAGRPGDAQPLLQRIERLGFASAPVHAHLGELAAAAGDHVGAREHLWHAMLLTEDQTVRSRLAQRLHAVTTQAGSLKALRVAARDRLADKDLAAAESLLHTARRQQADPALDYRLASQLHQRQEDAMGALACALLAREYEPAASPFTQLADLLLPTGLAALTRQLTRGVQPELAMSVVQPRRLLPAAAPVR